MQIRQSLWKLNLLVQIGLFALAGSQPAFAEEILPTITVSPPREPLEELIDKPQIIEEGDLTVAHERSI